MTSRKQLRENSRSNSLWRVLLNFHCQVQLVKWSTTSEQWRISICQGRKYRLTLVTYLRASKSTTVEKSSCIMTVDHMIQKDYSLSPHHQTWVFWSTLRDCTATAPFLHHVMFSITYTQFTVNSRSQTYKQVLWFTHESRTRNKKPIPDYSRH